jgi:hypothetical protein
MNDSPDEIPTFEELAADPEIAALLDFEPVPRSHAKANGWTADMQRMFIAWLAHYGSPTNACDELGKARSGIDKVYKSPDAEEFRASWEGAVELAERRRIARIATRRGGAGAMRAPSIVRLKSPVSDEADWDEEPALSDDDKWDLLQRIVRKLMKKVAIEREARLAGEIVAADFYLRQVTMIEVTLDLLSTGFGRDPQDVLRELRRGEHGIIDIASTWFSDWMDASRRSWWASEGEPERPPHPDVRFLERHRSDEGDYATEQDMYAGAWAKPPPGVDEGAWQAMTRDEQQAAIDRVREEDAAAQREWESRAYEEWERRAREARGASEHGAGNGAEN